MKLCKKKKKTISFNKLFFFIILQFGFSIDQRFIFVISYTFFYNSLILMRG